MAKREEHTQPIKVEIKMTNSELYALDLEVTAAGGSEKWLELKGAVVLDPNGRIKAIRDYGQNGEHDIPYEHLSKQLDQLSDYRGRVEYAKKKEVEGLLEINT